MRWTIIVALLSAAAAATAPAFGQGGGHILFGDLTVDEEGAPPLHSITFQVVLQSPSGSAIDRQTVSPGGRYRFMNVANGDYSLVVESQNRVVARLDFRIDEFRPTDIRKDLELAWSGSAEAAPPSAGLVYARSPENEELLKQAGERLAANDNKAARRLLEELLAHDERDFEAWTELGSVHFGLEDWKRAESAYSKALQLQPDYFPARLNLGKLHLARKKGPAAVEALGAAVTLRPDSAEAQYFLGEAYLAIRKGSLAVGHLEAALELEPDKMAEAHLRLAALYKGAGMNERAAEECRRYLEKRPDSEQAPQLRRFIEQHSPPRD